MNLLLIYIHLAKEKGLPWSWWVNGGRVGWGHNGLAEGDKLKLMSSITTRRLVFRSSTPLFMDIHPFFPLTKFYVKNCTTSPQPTPSSLQIFIDMYTHKIADDKRTVTEQALRPTITLPLTGSTTHSHTITSLLYMYSQEWTQNVSLYPEYPVYNTEYHRTDLAIQPLHCQPTTTCETTTFQGSSERGPNK